MAQGPRPTEERERIAYDFAWHWVNTCAGNKTAAYSKACGEKKSNNAAQCFYRANREKIDKHVEKFRAENRAEYPHMRDNNIALLSEIAVNGDRNSDRIAAIKELNSMCGFNTTNVNLNGKVDSDIEVNITNL